MKIMSYYKMNCFQIHLNDNGFKSSMAMTGRNTRGFRLESTVFPDWPRRAHYSKKEFVELQMLAEQYGVTVLPEIDVPAHSLAFTPISRKLLVRSTERITWICLIRRLICSWTACLQSI